jgi:hypothetical protein
MKSLVLADLIANTLRMIQLRFKGQGISLYPSCALSGYTLARRPRCHSDSCWGGSLSV